MPWGRGGEGSLGVHLIPVKICRHVCLNFGRDALSSLASGPSQYVNTLKKSIFSVYILFLSPKAHRAVYKEIETQPPFQSDLATLDTLFLSRI